MGWIRDMCYLASGLLVVGGFGSGPGLVVFNEDGLETEHHLNQVHGENRNLRGVCTDNRYGRVYIIENRGKDTPGYVHRHTPREHQWTHGTIKVLRNYNELHMYEVSDGADSRSIWYIQMSDKVSSVGATSDDPIVVCVWRREVCLLDTKGHQLCRLDTGHPQIEPLGVCLDVFDDILVCDYKSNSLFLYDKTRKFIKNVLSLPCDLPRSVKLLKHKSVVVSDGKRVYVYKR